MDTNSVWTADAFPRYIQSNDGGDFCRNWESAFPRPANEEDDTYEYVTRKGKMIWEAIRCVTHIPDPLAT